VGEGVAMRRLTARGLVLAALLGLAGCGTDPAVKDNPFLLGMQGLREAFGKGAGDGAEAPALTRAMVDQVQVPLLLATLESRGRSGTLVPIGQNGADTTWATSDQVAVIMRGGVVRGTRGLGEDLMSAAIPNESALRRTGQAFERSYFHLDGDDQTVRRSYSCRTDRRESGSLVILEKRFRAQRVEERCRGEGGGFSNEYWFLSDGRLIQSRQWISPSVGFLKLQRLKP
jgi:hypothetical protein